MQTAADTAAADTPAPSRRPSAQLTAAERAARINDTLRRSVGRRSQAASLLGEVHASAGVAALSATTQAAICAAVRTATDYSCDETSERACGVVEVAGVSVVWVVTAYDRAAYPRELRPARDRDNLATTVRRLVIALADEY